MPLAEETEEKIRDDILGGEYRAGERLIEANLIARYDVSRTIVREALRNLSATGLLTYVPQKGHSVRKFSLADVENIYNLLILLEGYACELAVARLGPGDLERLGELHRQMSDNIGVKDSYHVHRDLNVRFHQVFIQASGNDILAEEIGHLRMRIYTFRYLALTLHDALTTYVGEHGAVLEALYRKDTAGVKARMQAHITSVKDNLIKILKTSPLV